jgi:two-component system, NtrC family, nitrogen regulation response regulator GlnG
MNHVWIVDDEPSICWALRKGLESGGFQVTLFSSAEACLEYVARGNPYPAVVLLDVRLPGTSGLELLPKLQTLPSQPAVIVMTAFGDLKIAVDAVRGKAFDYLTKPFDLCDALESVHRAIGNAATSKLSADSQLANKLHKEVMLGSSAAMQRVYKQIAIAAESDAPVLILGEPGTGKSIVAAMIHSMSRRAPHPLLFFRPDASRPADADAELFGSRLAQSSVPGLLTLVGSGTLVIEELAALTTVTQSKLLSAMETGRFQAVMSVESEPLQSRLLFTSAQELDQAMADGELLESFLAEVRVLTIPLPPLRERCEDIPPLVQAFLAHESPNRVMHITDLAVSELVHRVWPGNVRELRQTIQGAILKTRGDVIDVCDLPNAPRMLPREGMQDNPAEELSDAARRWLLSQRDASGFLYEECLAIVERALIDQLMQEHEGNRAAIAAQLGIHRATLRQKMKRLGL